MVGLEQIFQIHTLLALAGGVIFGLFWGALPGLSTSMVMALLVGISAIFPLPLGVAFLLGVYVGSTSGGEMTAVLINIPGTPDALPLTIEGYPLTKRGEGPLALGMAYVASFLGGWIGILFLILLVPLVIKVALRFSSWEMALLGLWGVVIAGNLTSGERPIKGWISGWLGLLVSMVGREMIYGYNRFTFGSAELVEGIDYIPVLIGLFGLAEVARVLSVREQVSVHATISRIIPPWSMVKRYWKAAVRGSLIGALIGAIPGAGANVATYVSYDIAKRTAPPDEREKFGQGSYEGIVAAEVADNANIGGSLLPTLTLGIPGSAPAAAFMASLTLLGIRVGPLINRDHPGFLYYIYGVLILANFIMYGFALLMVKPAVRLFSLPRELLMPIISVICVVGAFELNLSMFDVGTMFAFGIVGFLLQRFGFPLAPMVLGAILGPMVDENLRRTLVLYENRPILELFTRPIGIALLILILFTLYDGVFRAGKVRKVRLPLEAVRGEH
ncbi:MAG: tripartite tricarboxylate transporter permease [Armatimonadota bacterium]|nr:tripartite tricarboxylate transporter permease [Armatimonadota bacterium]MDR5702712.1 tripartite tricarboxylate transporter permease [Armatimonadota bacterium]